MALCVILIGPISENSIYFDRENCAYRSGCSLMFPNFLRAQKSQALLSMGALKIYGKQIYIFDEFL